MSPVSKPASVRIKIKIDESGRVVSAHALLDGSKPDKAVTAAATAAVKQWLFEPAKKQGKNVPSEETVEIHVGPQP